MAETKKKHEISEKAWQQIHSALENLQFGSVTVVVHEGKIVQIETNEKTRLG